MTTALDDLLAISDDEYAALDADGQATYHAMLGRLTALSSPAMFAVAHSSGLWQPYRHLTITSQAIVDMIEHDTCDCLIVEEPVRHGKTELCSRWTPAWYVCRYRDRVGLASYEADFAATHGRRARNIVEQVGGLYDIRIDPSSNAANRWDLLGTADAGMWTAGAGGPITGKGYGLGIVDDPIKNAEDAASKVQRDKTWEWWQTVFLTRRNGRRAKLLVIMSRWHVDDIVGRLETLPTGMRIKVLRFPALAEDDDPLGRHPGEALCPELFDENALDQFREDSGPSAWSSLYQQRPTPPGGGMFKRASFRYWTRVGAGDHTLYALGDDTFIDPKECWTFSTMDTAYTRNQRSDYTVLATWCVAPTKPAPSLMLLDVARVRVEGNEHVPMMERVWERWRPAWIGIEKQNATRSLFDEASLRGIVTTWLKPSTNKVARAESAVALLDAGRIWFPKGASFLSDYEEELLTFPVGPHDDQVDVTAYAAAELIARRVHPRPLHHKPTTLEERCWAQIERRSRRSSHHPVIGRMQ